MLITINKHNQHLYQREMVKMYQLRKKVFIDTLGWELDPQNGMEIDQFDTEDAHYIIDLLPTGEVSACVRLLPTQKPYLLKDVFPFLVEDGEVACSEHIWEATRFCADPESTTKEMTSILLAAMHELAFHLNISHYVSVIDIRVERIIKLSGWLPKRLGSVHTNASGKIVSNELTVSPLSYRRLLANCANPTACFIQNINELEQAYKVVEAA